MNEECDQNQVGYAFRRVLGSEAKGLTALDYLARHFRHSTHEQWADRCGAGEVLLDGQVAAGDLPLRPGGVLVWNRPAWVEPAVRRRLDVIYSDEHVLVVEKPSGLPTLPGAGFFRNTLLEIVRERFPGARPMHRLGRGTSGLVLFAHTTSAARSLHAQWPSIRKQYLGLATGVAMQDSYDIQVPIGPVEHPRLGTVHAAHCSGKAARTVARVFERFDSSTLFECDLHTGRPHQIRIHLASLGHPLVGDPLYVAGGVIKPDTPALPGDGGYWLHARRLVFVHPASGHTLDVRSATDQHNAFALEDTVLSSQGLFPKDLA
jgi:23S rRNA pseudouridine1911/1915/1917 synthase